MRTAFFAVFAAVAAAGVHADDWPQFRGPHRDNISRETGLLRAWPEGGPRVLWTVEVCEGYAGPAVYGGRVYLNDYDRESQEWLVRCLSLSDGREIWRYKDPKRIRPNHGITRTVPAVDGKYVFSLDPKCVFHCLDAQTGAALWRKELVRDYGAAIPPWYNGQCPLIEDDRVILGIGGRVLLVALDKQTGREIWQTPNPANWPLSHASVMPAEIAGVRQYLWCTLFGPLGVRAADGKLLWHHDRKFNVAIAPSPLALGADRVFVTSGYEGGTLLLCIERDGDAFRPTVLLDWTADAGILWNSEVHTPIHYNDCLFAVGKTKRGLFTCLDLDGKVLWDSEGQAAFELGSYILADGLLFALEGQTGMLRLLEANSQAYRELDRAQVLSGHDVWGPMALADGKLVLRDMTKLVCVQVGAANATTQPARATAPRETGEDGNLRVLLASIAQPGTRYRKARTIAGQGKARGEFERALRAVSTGPDDALYAVGDACVVVFTADGSADRRWPTEKPGHAIAVTKDRVYVGSEGQIEIFDLAGTPQAVWRDAARLGLPTAIAIANETVYVADVQEREIRRYSPEGTFRGNLQEETRGRGFLTPNRCLDLVAAPDGTLWVANPGKHRVERYEPDGRMRERFGRFDPQNEAGFTGCCNPTNLAMTPDGNLVVTTKAPPGVKVYTAQGALLCAFGAGDFDSNGKNLDVAVDSRGRIHIIDSERLTIVTYEPAAPATQESSPPAQHEVSS